jgi:lysophospholipase L1-like esterase
MPRKTAVAILVFGFTLWICGRGPNGATILAIVRERVPEKPVVPAPIEEAGTTILPSVGELWLDSTGSMHTFYESLLRTEQHQPGAITRILHYGDSPTTGDLITADIRAMLQARFGDGGHGFVLIGKPWAWYQHRGVTLEASGWTYQPASQGSRAPDSLHGLGGVSIIGRAGATSRITLPDEFHRTIEVLYLKQPSGGTFQLKAGDEVLLDVSTAADAKSDGYSKALLPAHTRIVSVTVTQGTVRIFGVTVEKNGPGVVYSSLGLNGVSIQTLERYYPAAHWADELRHANPDLVVMNYGSNEVSFAKYIDQYYAKELRTVLERIHTALPNTAILVMSPMDRGERNDAGQIVTMAALPKLIDIQRQVSQQEGCAFFDTYHAMGGSGTMAKWYAEKPRLVSADFLHPMPAGAAKVAELYEQALMQEYERWKAARQ